MQNITTTSEISFLCVPCQSTPPAPPWGCTSRARDPLSLKNPWDVCPSWSRDVLSYFLSLLCIKYAQHSVESWYVVGATKSSGGNGHCSSNSNIYSSVTFLYCIYYLVCIIMTWAGIIVEEIQTMSELDGQLVYKWGIFPCLRFSD